ncbi:putative N-formylglutamate amidohydrolase [Legionella massiliensis]|uniref:Putative N-formylglutamate amidohydrolase n=1 Tax=Legionella massiliensis TaxID=1034943 RepID=A0A078KU88_9GAMM|nr:N-formylglutamate amidohydrolase [Legionella massiliensis]CDZ78010.1 putative N-formylglutamate amidohydrolase [Legionella massiliensis]CEE13748.1 N-formylglutamate amidohydrolase [Legionella massiliensis]
MKTIELVLSCEHAVNTVPENYQALFAPYQDLLQTHRGIDFGALSIASGMSKYFNCDFVQAETTRLLIDCNRSLANRQCFSEVTAPLSQEEKNQLIEKYYLPFRQQVEKNIRKHIQQGKQVLHISVHSFTPIMNGVTRKADLGLLYDPKRSIEKTIARQWQQQLRQDAREPLQVRLNYPYRGISDGFTTALRKAFSDKDYAGIEIETNQALVNAPSFLDYWANLLSKSLKHLMEHN